jgi:monovalent cation:H+ antiporter-2, CPA2 family
MHLHPLISDLAMILGVAALVTLIFQKIKQPVVLGYIVAGFIVGPYTPSLITVTDLPDIKVLAELGVIFLMFSLGLEFTFSRLARAGKTAMGTALVELPIMMAVGYGAGQFLNWPFVDCLFLSGMLSISSTTIILKAYDEQGLKTRRFAEIVFGVLIVEDLFAILLLASLSTVVITQNFLSAEIIFSALQLILVVGGWFLFGYFLIPSFLRYTSKHLSNETLMVLSTGLCLLLVVLATHFNYSAALGAFIMGSILSETDESGRIERLIQPIRDLFAAVFFVSVGMLVDPVALQQNIGPILILTMLLILGKVVSNTVGAMMTGQPLKRSVQIGFSLGQIGEFSFIIATLGEKLGVTSKFLYPIIVAVSVITTFTTPYFIKISGKCGDFLEDMLPPTLKTRFAGYSTWALSPGDSDDARQVAWRQVLRHFLNGIIVTIIFLGMAEYGLPKLQAIFPSSYALFLAGWALSVLLSAPFVWGMFFAFRSRTLGLPIFLGRLTTIVWLGILSSAFFPTRLSLLITLICAGGLFFIFFRRLEQSYVWFERRLLSNIKGTGEPDSELATLAPWDLYLTRLTLHQNSPLAGKQIKEAEIRSRYGLNIAAIQRGREIIAAPSSLDKLLPYDDLLVLGTDDQVDRFRREVETPSDFSGTPKELSDYALRRVLVTKGSEYVDRSIRESGIRENLKGLVVGLERGDFRTINPDPAFTLQVGDILWIVSGLI